MGADRRMPDGRIGGSRIAGCRCRIAPAWGAGADMYQGLGHSAPASIDAELAPFFPLGLSLQDCLALGSCRTQSLSAPRCLG